MTDHFTLTRRNTCAICGSNLKELEALRESADVLNFILAMDYLTPDGLTERWAKEVLKKLKEARPK